MFCTFAGQMKKIYLGILAILYMAVSSGVAMELHYCMGNKAGMDLYGSATDKCGKCGMKEDKTGCCHDEFKFYKLNDFHKNVVNEIDFSAKVFAINNNHFVYNWQSPENTALISPTNYAPPDYTAPPACILNCVFRI